MKVLLIDEEVPWPINTGKRIRTYQLVKRLQERHEITYLCYGEEGAVLPGCQNVSLVTLPSTVLPQKGGRFYWALLCNLLSTKPYIVVRHYSKALAGKAQSLLQTGGYSLLHCEWTPYTENIRNVLGVVPTVLSAHNVEAQIWERYLLTEQNLFKKLYIYPQWRKLVRYEKNSSTAYSAVVTVSENDRQVFVDEYGCSKVTVVSNGVDQDYFQPSKAPIVSGNMVFTGSMDWRPNQDGVHYFIEHVFPLIQARIPSATFTVVGRNPPQWLIDAAKATSGVVLTGTVDDVRPFIAKSAAYVVPLRVGGGSRLKILEAWAMEKAVISTTLGAEGLAAEDGSNILLRDTPQAMAEAACQVLQNQEQFISLGKAGRQVVERHYTWDALAGQMHDVWESTGG